MDSTNDFGNPGDRSPCLYSFILTIFLPKFIKFKNNIGLNSIIDTNVIFIYKYMVVNLELV